MNFSQLHNALNNAKETGHHFRGVYTRDNLPRNLRKGFYKVNFDKKGKPGSHWICIEKGDEIVYFDSYGECHPSSSGLHGTGVERKRLCAIPRNCSMTTQQLLANGACTLCGGDAAVGP